MDGTNFKDFKAEVLKDTKVRKQYEALKPKYAIIESIIARRIELSISQRKLAQLVGMQQPAICRLESGDKDTRIETLVKVANALDLEIECRPKALERVDIEA